MKRHFAILLVSVLGCNYDNLQNIDKQLVGTQPKSVPLIGRWIEVRTTMEGCSDSSLNRTTVNSGLNTEEWNVADDSLGVTLHGTLTVPYSYTVEGNSICLRNGTLNFCYTFIQAGDTLTLISQQTPTESCITERVLIKE